MWPGNSFRNWFPCCNRPAWKCAAVLKRPNCFRAARSSPPLTKIGTEYGDLKITIKVVSDMTQAIEHINHYGSRHTESILTQDQRAAELFMNEVDAASVFHNASTRFANGFRYGLNAEL